MPTLEVVRYFVCFFGGLAMMGMGSWWAMRHPRQKGEPFSGERKAWLTMIILGFALAATGFFLR